jgi:F0F1-type ATP synthase assembly protein I
MCARVQKGAPKSRGQKSSKNIMALIWPTNLLGGHFTSFQIGLFIDTVQDPSGFTMVICPILFMKHTSNSTRRNLKTRNSWPSSINLWLNYSNSPTFSYHTASYHRMIPLTFTIIPVTENDDFGHDQILESPDKSL